MSKFDSKVPAVSEWPQESQIRASLLDLLVAPEHHKNRLYNEIFERHHEILAHKINSLPALKAHVTIVLKDVCVSRELHPDLVPFLAEAMIEYLHQSTNGGTHKTRKAITQFAEEACIDRRSAIELVRSGIEKLYRGPANTQNGAASLSAEEKTEITKKILLLQSEEPLSPGDRRLIGLAEEFSVTPGRIRALKAWVTMRVRDELISNGVTSCSKGMIDQISGLIGLVSVLNTSWEDPRVSERMNDIIKNSGGKLAKETIKAVVATANAHLLD